MSNRVAKSEIRALHWAIMYCKRMTNLERDYRLCSLPIETRRAVQPYMDTWILPDLENLLRYLKGEKKARKEERRNDKERNRRTKDRRDQTSTV